MNNIIIGIPYEILDYQKNIPLIPRDIKLLINNLKIQIYMHDKIFDNSFFKKEDYTILGVNILEDINELYDKCNFIIKINELDETEYYLINNKHTIICFINTDKFMNYCINNFINIISYNTINNNIITKLYETNIVNFFNQNNYENSNILVIDDNNIAKYYIEIFEKLNLNYKVCSHNKIYSKYIQFNNRNLKKYLFESNIIFNFTTIDENLLNYIDYNNSYIQFHNNYEINNYYKHIQKNNYKLYLINLRFLNLYPDIISNIISEILYNYIDYNIRNKTTLNYTLYNGIIINKLHKDFII
jgi:hypothetical protein